MAYQKLQADTEHGQLISLTYTDIPNIGIAGPTVRNNNICCKQATQLIDSNANFSNKWC